MFGNFIYQTHVMPSSKQVIHSHKDCPNIINSSTALNGHYVLWPST